ncbi:MAG: cell surface protein SprA, partial [Bacteroidales bacterium]|nr:cell surface protein SprA [Bacteroidales bacterium]
YKAKDKGWLLCSDDLVTPATMSQNRNLSIRATLEPFKDVKIDLSATRNETKNSSVQYMFDGMPTTCTGSFSMTTISIGSAFEKTGSPDKGYKSKTFEKFVNSLAAYRDRVEAQYAGAPYPANSALAGQTFDPANGTVSPYAANVMIPAFLDTYTAGGSGLDIFPKLSALLPNWSVSYGGLGKLPKMKKVFKSFNLNHAYKSVYTVGSYSSFTSYQEYMNGFGFVTDVATGSPVPSCEFDVSTVSINESFSPLIGVDMTFVNNITTKVEYRKTRVLTLSMTSQQLSESRSNDLVIGLGYKISNLNLFAPKKTVKSKAKRTGSSAQNSDNAKKTGSTGFASDLNLRLDFTIRNQSVLNRDIATLISQATSGNKAVQVSFAADYALSKYITLTAYYDRQMNKPLLTSSSYPVTTQDFGFSIKFILNR